MTFWDFSKADKVWKMVDFIFEKSKFFSFLEIKKNFLSTCEVSFIHSKSPLNSASAGWGHNFWEAAESWVPCTQRYHTQKFTFLVFTRKPSKWSPKSFKAAEKWIPHIRLPYKGVCSFKNGLWKNLFFSALVPPYKIFEKIFFSDWTQTFHTY